MSDPNRLRPECPMGSKPCGNPACAVRCNLLDDEPASPTQDNEFMRAREEVMRLARMRDRGVAYVKIEVHYLNGARSVMEFHAQGGIQEGGR